MQFTVNNAAQLLTEFSRLEQKRWDTLTVDNAQKLLEWFRALQPPPKATSVDPVLTETTSPEKDSATKPEQALTSQVSNEILSRFVELASVKDEETLPRFQRLLTTFSKLESSLPEPLFEEPAEPPLLLREAQQLVDGFRPRQERSDEKEAETAPNLNIWEACGLRQDEVRNSAVLAWFMDPTANHGQGKRMLRCFLKTAPACRDLRSRLDNEPVMVRTEHWLDPESRTDIEIIGSSFAVVIEVKINAPLKLDQLERYWKMLTRRYPKKVPNETYKKKKLVCLILTKDGDIKNGDHEFKPIKWEIVADALELLADPTQDPQQSAKYKLVQELAQQYAKYINENL